MILHYLVNITPSTWFAKWLARNSLTSLLLVNSSALFWVPSCYAHIYTYAQEHWTSVTAKYQRSYLLEYQANASDPKYIVDYRTGRETRHWTSFYFCLTCHRMAILTSVYNLFCFPLLFQILEGVQDGAVPVVSPAQVYAAQTFYVLSLAFS